MKWQRASEYAERCGPYYVTRYVVLDKDVWLTWHEREILGRTDTREEAVKLAEDHQRDPVVSI